MGATVAAVLVFCLLGVTSAELSLVGGWHEGTGWELTCSWQTMLNDTLQSLRMYRNGQEFLVFRPEVQGIVYENTSISEQLMTYSKCQLAVLGGQRGRCLVKLQPHQNGTQDTYKCETSGERPTFKLESGEYTIFAPPTAASVKQVEARSSVPRPALNCTSSGLPAPRLIWNVDANRIPEDFTHTRWNFTSKLWDSWSTYTPQHSNAMVVCTPESRGVGGLVAGQSAVWVANAAHVDVPRFVIMLLSISALLLR